jgi:hypothetical protein
VVQYALPACPACSFSELIERGALDPFRVLSIAEGSVVTPVDAAGLHIVRRLPGLVADATTLLLAYRVRRFDRRAASLLIILTAGILLLWCGGDCEHAIAGDNGAA